MLPWHIDGDKGKRRVSVSEKDKVLNTALKTLLDKIFPSCILLYILFINPSPLKSLKTGTILLIFVATVPNTLHDLVDTSSMFVE